MTAETLAPAMSDDLYNSIRISHPDACRTHHCWVDQCPPGSHDDPAAAEGGVA